MSIQTTWSGERVFESEHQNGDTVRIRFSRFHGAIVTVSRTYMGEETPREVTAYLGDVTELRAYLDEMEGGQSNGS